METMKRVLVLGCGSIGERHIRCLGHAGGAEITACDPREERLAAMRELYQVAGVATSYDEVDLSAQDAVMVCTPTDQHIPQALRAAQAGCHLFVEKPISTALEGVDALLALCREKQLVVQMGYVIRHHPNLKEIKRLLDAGAIGTVYMAQIKSGYFIGNYRPEYASLYWAHAATGGGVMMDASHQLDWIQWLLGPVTHVGAMAEHFMIDVDADVEDGAVLMLRFASRALASVSLSNFQRNYKAGLELNGSKGSIEWSYGDSEVRVYTEEDRSWRSHSETLERDEFYIAQAKSFLSALAGEAPVWVSGEDGRRALAVGLAAYESARTGRVVEVG
jgi:predicted dehydrogenase